MNPNAAVFVPGGSSQPQPQPQPEAERAEQQPEPPGPDPEQADTSSAGTAPAPAPAPEPAPEPEPELVRDQEHEKPRPVERSQLAASLAALQEPEAAKTAACRQDRLAALNQHAGTSSEWDADLAMAKPLPLDGEEASPRVRKVNSTLSDFKVLHVVGRGGFGKVRAQRWPGGKTVAVKLLRDAACRQWRVSSMVLPGDAGTASRLR